MTYPFSVSEARFVRKETLKAMVQGSIPPAIAMWFLFTDFPMPLWGNNGFGIFQFKNSFGMGVLMALLMSLGMRAGRAKGTVPALGWTRDNQPLLRLIPRNLVVRVVVFALATALVVAPLSLGIAILLGSTTIDHLPFTLFMGVQCASNALFLAPLILIGAMTDPITLTAKVVT